MKCFRCCCSVLLCLVLLLGVSSLPANALEPEDNDYIVNVNAGFDNGDSGYSLGNFSFIPSNGTVEKTSVSINSNFPGWIHPDKRYMIRNNYNITNQDGTILVGGGRPVKFTFNNLYHSILLEPLRDNDGSTISYIYFNEPTTYRAAVFYTDGTADVVDFNYEYNPSNRWFSIDFSFTPKKDVERILLQCDITISDTLMQYDGSFRLTNYIGEYNGDSNIEIIIERSSEESGLLSGILGWIKNTFDAVTNGFSNVVSTIAELPSKIWQKISDGLKGLFVPDEQYLTSYKYKWSSLLSDRLGAVYQVVEVTFGAWDEVGESDKTDSISMPEVTIPLPDDNEFSFGGYEVKIVPDGFDFLATAVKSIVGVVCTLAFINGIRKRYDEIMGVDQ